MLAAEVAGYDFVKVGEVGFAGLRQELDVYFSFGFGCVMAGCGREKKGDLLCSRRFWSSLDRCCTSAPSCGFVVVVVCWLMPCTFWVLGGTASSTAAGG